MTLGNTSTAPANNQFTRTGGGFVPPNVPETGTVRVQVLQSMRAESVTPLQKVQGRDGTFKEQARILVDLVGIYIDIPVTHKDKDGRDVTVMESRLFPDPERKTPMPKIGSAEWNALMVKPSGLFVESMFPEDMDEIESELEAGTIGFPFTLEEFKRARADGTGNTLMRTFGGWLRANGFIKRKELTMADVMGGSKTLQINFFNGEEELYVKGYKKAAALHGFNNVAFAIEIGECMTVSDLSNGPSFSPQGVYFQYAEPQAGFGGRKEYSLDMRYTTSGALYGIPITSAKSVSDLCRMANNANANGTADATDKRRREREEAQKRAMQGGQVTPAYADMDNL